LTRERHRKQALAPSKVYGVQYSSTSPIFVSESRIASSKLNLFAILRVVYSQYGVRFCRPLLLLLLLLLGI
jgi:hypothetical protein